MFQRCTHIVRSLHRSCPQMIKKKPTPGAGRQLKALGNADEFVDDPEGFGNFESDFMNVGKTHRQHEAELQVQRDHVRHIMVKRKYFKDPKLPALLLYAEKNEIRTLHARDPDEWTIEKLSESFPATPDTIKKIINSKWRPYSVKRMHKHDEAVIRNWENLKNGIGIENIPAELLEHLLKFAKRMPQSIAAIKNDTEAAALLLPKLPTPKGNEFSSIITSCKQYAETPKEHMTAQSKESQNKEKFTPNVDPTDETYLIDRVTDKRKMRLQEFQLHNLTKNEELSSNLDKLTKNPFNEEATAVASVRNEHNPSTDFMQKFETNEIVISKEDTKKYEITPYKDQIYIPRKLWRKGGTYRVDDCYYDDDGEFLYRVPGMSGAKKTMQ